MALAFFCATELPLVVAITTLAVDAGEMRSSTAAGLVGAAMLSTLIYPFVGMALRAASLARPAAPRRRAAAARLTSAAARLRSSSGAGARRGAALARSVVARGGACAARGARGRAAPAALVGRARASRGCGVLGERSAARSAPQPALLLLA